MQIKSYDEINSWKKAIEIIKEIYAITSLNPIAKDRSLCDQMRRASVSIASNIAEGYERNNNNEFIRYLTIAKGSAGELRTQIIISSQVGFIERTTSQKLTQDISDVMNLIGAFISYLKKFKNSQTRNSPTR